MIIDIIFVFSGNVVSEKLCSPGWHNSGMPCMDCARAITENFTKTMCLRAGHHIVRNGVMENVDHSLMICCQG